MATSEIMIAPVNIYYAPTGTANPDETSIDFAEAWGGAWVNAGYTTAALTMNLDVETFELEVQQSTSPVKGMKVRETLTFETVLAELTAAHMKLAMGSSSTVSTTAAGAGQKGYEEVGLGGEAYMPEYKFGFEGYLLSAANAKLPVRIFVHRATFVLGGALEFSKSAAAGIPIRVQAWADTAQSEGQQLFVFQRVTAVATS